MDTRFLRPDELEFYRFVMGYADKMRDEQRNPIKPGRVALKAREEAEQLDFPKRSSSPPISPDTTSEARLSRRGDDGGLSFRGGGRTGE